MRQRIRSESGAALVELAVSLPLLALILVGTIDFSRVFYTGIALENAARAGAQYGAHSVGSSGDTSGMEAAALAATNLTGVSASASRTCQCATTDGATFSPIPAGHSCSESESSLCSGDRLVITVTVQTSATFTLTGSYPQVPNNLGLTRSATLRVPN